VSLCINVFHTDRRQSVLQACWESSPTAAAKQTQSPEQCHTVLNGFGACSDVLMIMMCKLEDNHTEDNQWTAMPDASCYTTNAFYSQVKSRISETALCYQVNCHLKTWLLKTARASLEQCISDKTLLAALALPHKHTFAWLRLPASFASLQNSKSWHKTQSWLEIIFPTSNNTTIKTVL